MLKDFVDARATKWQKLEQYVNTFRKQRLNSLSRFEVREFGQLYRRTAADLAIAHEEVRDSRLVNYLNNLVVRAHGLIYRTEKGGINKIAEFFRYDLPAVFRQTFRYTLLAFLISMAGTMLGAALTIRDVNFSDVSFPGMRDQVERHENWTENLNKDNPTGAASIQTNNIMVSLYAFVGGLTAGLFSAYILFFNGVMLGVISVLCVKYKFWDILIFMFGHGVLELSAIFISGGAGLLLAQALLMPGDLTRRQAFVENGKKAVKLIMGVIVMLLIAGTIEGFISPAKISPIFKYTVSLSSGILMVLYYMKPDRRVKSATATT
ncbi:MAG TPA: stage II sporulation protein M [Blastocatellia bacterium]|nr:stage II sporulation protein M [Blastocatellia bacterium]